MARREAARGWKALEISFETHSAWVPELSESRYLWTSKTRFVVDLSRLVTVDSAAREPSDTKLPAEV